MNRVFVTSVAVAAIAALSACAGTSSPAVRGGLPPVPGSAPSHRTTHARLLIKVPPQKHRKKIRVHGHYISPATASLTYTVSPALAGGATNGEIDINTGNPDCQSTGVVGYLACGLEIDGVVPGTPYTFAFTTWDGAGGGGNQLSGNDDVPFTATVGATNVLQAALGGVATSMAVTSMAAQRMTGSSAGYRVFGNDPVKFSVVAMDADDDFIIGPGAPQPTVSPSSGAPIALATVGPSSPNEWTLTSSFAATDPSTPSTASLAISATPVPGSGGSTVSATVPVALYQPWIYLVDTFGVLRAYDEHGTAIAGFTTVTLPPTAAVTFGAHRIYVVGTDGTQAGNSIAAYPPLGGTAIVTATPSTIPALGVVNFPNKIVYDSGNGELYTQDSSDGDVLSFDGDLTQNIASVNEGSSGNGLAYIASTQQIAAVFNGSTVRTCSENLASCPTIKSASYNSGVGFDPLASQLGVCASSTGLQLVGLTGVNGIKIGSVLCDATAFDPYDAQWYVVPQSSGAFVQAFTESGSSVPLTGGFAGLTFYPQSITIAP